MSKLTKEDLALWNYYTSNITEINKKIELSSHSQKNEKERKSLPLTNKNNLILKQQTKKMLKNKKFVVDAFLDLHGLSQIEAKIKIKEFVQAAFLKKKRHIIIITGKGENNKGILKNKTPNWLAEEEISKYIIGFINPPEFLGGDGAIYINIKNINKYTSNIIKDNEENN